MSIPNFLAFNAELSEVELAELLEMDEVEFIEPNGIMHALQQANPPSWGLPRTGQRHLPLDNIYNWKASGGAGVDVFVGKWHCAHTLIFPFD